MTRKYIISAILVGYTALLLSGCGNRKDMEDGIMTVESTNASETAKTEISTTIPTPTEMPFSQRHFIAIENVVNVYKTKSANSKVIDYFYMGDRVNVIGVEAAKNTELKDRWYKVRLYEGTENETEGYVSIKDVNEAHGYKNKKGEK